GARGRPLARGPAARRRAAARLGRPRARVGGVRAGGHGRRVAAGGVRAAALRRSGGRAGHRGGAAGARARAGAARGRSAAARRRALVRARVRRGELARADSTLAGDSSVDAAALRGWVALYRGDLKAGADLFRAAGPYAGDRSDATERTAMLALLQQVRRDRFP